MYCLKCRRVTDTENIATATSKNGRLMTRGQCVTCRKTKTQFIKRDAFLILWSTNCLSKSICQVITLHVREKTI